VGGNSAVEVGGEKGPVKGEDSVIELRGEGSAVKVATTQTTSLASDVEETTESKLDEEDGWFVEEESNETWSGLLEVVRKLVTCRCEGV
jgi:predicted house-cleaning noncanonical NTP pyrophosphatase (MazG superfamily)